MLLVPQLLDAETVTLPVPVPQVTSILFEPCPAVIVPFETVQLYPVAEGTAVEKFTKPPLHQTGGLAVIVTGVAGAPSTARVRVPPLPHAFTPLTVIIPETKLFGKSIETPLKLLGNWIVAPPVIVHRYDVAADETLETKNETPVVLQFPVVGPEMLPGVPGSPDAIPLQRRLLALPHELTDDTHTWDPGGIEPGNEMLQDVPDGVTIAPGTVVDQL